MTEWEIPASPDEVDDSDIIGLGRVDNEIDVREKVVCELDYSTDDYIVYFVECELFHSDQSFEKVKQGAVEMLPSGNAPSWLYPAYKSDEVYYIGQTSRFSQRIADHHCRVRVGDGHKTEPSKLTAISRCQRAGIITSVEYRHLAEEDEYRVGNAWRGDDGRFVYFA